MSKYEILYSSPNYILRNKETKVVIKKSPFKDVIERTKKELEEDDDSDG